MKVGKKQLLSSRTVEIVGAFEAKTNLSRLLREANAGKHFVITQRGKPVAELHPPTSSKPKPGLWGDMKGEIKMAEDFRDPLPEFESYFT
jgi:prevent-host-death family protein